MSQKGRLNKIPMINIKKLMRLSGIIVLCLALYYITASSPDNTISFSHPSGFYPENFYLEISVPDNCTVHYTLDGSTPDIDSPVYSSPLLISDATPNDNIYSAIKDISAHESIMVPDYPVDKCTVVRAVAINNAGTAGNVVSASYFVGITPERYNSINTISLITDPENLFDYHNGIYVKGEKYDQYLISGDHSKATYYWDCNYTQRGLEWERPAVAHFFDNNGNLILEKKLGIRIRGQTSRAKVQKGFNLYARPSYDTTDNFETDIFGSGYIPHSISLMNGGNEPALQFQDYAMTELCKGLNVSTALYKPYVLFIDGEFWGFYWLAEKFDSNYFAHYYDVDPDKVVMIKGEKVEIGEEKDILLYNNMVEFISNNDMSVAENYAKACEMIDIDSFTDYFATMIYVARSHDWLNFNTSLWRTRDTQDGEYSDGKWRWIIYDCNGFTMGIASPSSYDHDTIGYAYEKSSIFRSLWSNEDFRSELKSKLYSLSDDNFSLESTEALINSFSSDIGPAMEYTWPRWYGSDNTKNEEFDQKLNTAKDFFEKRSNVVKGWFGDI